MIDVSTPRVVVLIGLGGIWEGYGFTLPSLHLTAELPMAQLLLVDGDRFEERNTPRQTFAKQEFGPKAVVRREQLLALYPDMEIRDHAVYVCRENVGTIVPDGTIVLLSPDNHPTRRLVSDHVGTLDNCLLICGGNDAIDEAAGTDGMEGWAAAHFRKEGRDLTAPITLYHPEILQAAGPDPTEQSCGELAAGGAPQIRRTNLLVGQQMLNMLLRYVQLSDEEAIRVAEVAVSSKTNTVFAYERPPDLECVS